MPCNDIYCISYTETSFDGNYTSGGTFNGELYWTGDTTPPYYIYYYTGVTNYWCLSTILGGTCLLSGKSPCTSPCPDLCEDFFSSGVCSTTTTTTSPCNVFDFDALFDCDVVPTPSPTPTPTITPTVTVTPTSTNFCSIIGIDAKVIPVSASPTPTPTPTPTSSPEVTRPCNFLGDVSFITIDGDINCPRSFQFQDCVNGWMYFSSNGVETPLGGSINQGEIYQANVDGVSRCIHYIGVNNDVIGVSQITLISGPLGDFNKGDCNVVCPSPNSYTYSNIITITE